MKLHRTIAMHTDHDSFSGLPIETSQVQIMISDDIEWTPAMLAEVERNAKARLHAMVKCMPHRYWRWLEASGFSAIAQEPRDES